MVPGVFVFVTLRLSREVILHHITGVQVNFVEMLLRIPYNINRSKEKEAV